MADPWLTVDQAAQYIGSSKQRIYLVAACAIAVGKDGRRTVIRRSTLDQYLTTTNDQEAK